MFDFLPTYSAYGLEPTDKKKLMSNAALLMGLNMLTNSDKPGLTGLGIAGMNTYGTLMGMVQQAARNKLLKEESDIRKNYLDLAKEKLGIAKERLGLDKQNSAIINALRGMQAKGLQQRVEAFDQFGSAIRQYGPPTQDQLVAEALAGMGAAPTAARLLYPDRFSAYGGLFNDLMGGVAPQAEEPQITNPAQAPSLTEAVNVGEQQTAAERAAKAANRAKNDLGFQWKPMSDVYVQALSSNDPEKAQRLYEWVDQNWRIMDEAKRETATRWILKLKQKGLL